MKKLISIIASAALVFALAIPVAAAGSPSAGQDVVASVGARDAAGNPIAVEVTAATLSPAESASINDAAVAAAGGETNITLDYINVEAPAGYFDTHDSIDLSFSRSNAANVVAVLYWNSATNSWDSASFTVNGDSIDATMFHLCTICFVMKTPVAPGASTDGSPTSPQTGVDYSAWITAAAVMVIGAGICFMTAKKKSYTAD